MKAKKFISALLIFALVISSPSVSLAYHHHRRHYYRRDRGISGERIFENVLSTVLSVLIVEAIREGMRPQPPAPYRPPVEVPAPAPVPPARRIPRASSFPGYYHDQPKVIELTPEQYEGFVIICKVGSLEEFSKKIRYENISPDAAYSTVNQKNEPVKITLASLAAKSPNSKLSEHLKSLKEKKGE